MYDTHSMFYNFIFRNKTSSLIYHIIIMPSKLQAFFWSQPYTINKRRYTWLVRLYAKYWFSYMTHCITYVTHDVNDSTTLQEIESNNTLDLYYVYCSLFHYKCVQCQVYIRDLSSR